MVASWKSGSSVARSMPPLDTASTTACTSLPLPFICMKDVASNAASHHHTQGRHERGHQGVA
eukprot:1144208-Pelagomonas_calceolata.AAC.3